MNTLNPKVDLYLAEGCGRCSLGGTPNCKVHTWQKELVLLRKIVLDCGLTEELKWSQPCYTFNGKNVMMVIAFKNFCVLSFFKGALLNDANNILVSPGENSQSAKWLQFTSVKEIMKLQPVIKAYIYETLELEKAGKKVAFKKITEHIIPEELQNKFNENPALKTAFTALTPGRQRGYLLHFSSAKLATTRESRIEKYIPQILKGKGFHD